MAICSLEFFVKLELVYTAWKGSMVSHSHLSWFESWPLTKTLPNLPNYFHHIGAFFYINTFLPWDSSPANHGRLGLGWSAGLDVFFVGEVLSAPGLEEPFFVRAFSVRCEFLLKQKAGYNQLIWYKYTTICMFSKIDVR